MIRLWLAQVRARGVRRGIRVAIAAVALATTAFLVAVPRAADRAYDEALVDRVVSAEDGLRDVTLRLKVEPQFGAFGVVADTVALHSPQPPFRRVDTVARQRLGAAFVDLIDTATYAAQTDPFVLTRQVRALPVEPPQAVVRIQSGLAEQVEWVAGAAPGVPRDVVSVPIPVLEGSEPLARRLDVVPVALAEETAVLWGVQVGDRFDLTAANFERGGDQDGLVEVVGVFRALDPAAPFWRADARMLATASVESFDGGVISQGALLAGEEGYAALSRSLQPMPERVQAQETTPAFEHTWRYRIDPSGLTAGDAGVLREGVARLRTAPGGWDGDVPVIATGLPSVLDRYAQDVRVASVLTLFASAGVAALAAFTLMAGVLGLLRVRRGEVRLLAARGMSRAQLARLLAGDVLVWVVPAAVAGSVIVLRAGTGAVPGRTWGMVAVVLTAPVVAALWAAWRVAAESGRRARPREGTARWGRPVLELAVTVTAVLLVVQLRGRASSIAAGTEDWVAALVPAVAGLAVGLIVVRLLPLLSRALAVLARRSRGATPLLAAAGIRATTAASLPIVALVVGTALVSLLATVGSSLSTDRALAAHQRIGADARIDALRVDPAGLAAVRSAPGVSAATAAFVGADIPLVGSSRTAEVELTAGDVRELAQARAGTPVALGPALRVAEQPVLGTGALAIALSRPLLPDEAIEIRLAGQRIPAQVVAVDPAIARVVDGRVVDTALVDLPALIERVTVQPTTVFVTAQDRGSSPLTSVAELPLEVDRESRVSVVGAAAERATSRLVARTFSGSALVAVVLLVLSVGLVILATRDSRALLGHRAEILGMPRREQRTSEILGLAPAVLVLALAGAALGSALPRLVGAAIDLSSLTGAVAGASVPASPIAAGAVGVGTVVLTLIALGVDRAVLRRRPLQSTLREGDHS